MKIFTPLIIMLVVTASCGDTKAVDAKPVSVNDYACILLRSGDGDPPDIMNIHDVVAQRLRELSKGKQYSPFSGKAYLLNGKTIVDYAVFIKRDPTENDLVTANKVLLDLNSNFGMGKSWRTTQMVMKYDAKGIEVEDEFIILFQTIWK